MGTRHDYCNRNLIDHAPITDAVACYSRLMRICILHIFTMPAATFPGPRKAGDDPFAHREFKAFVEMCTYLANVPSKPKVIILENTDGIDMKAASSFL